MEKRIKIVIWLFIFVGILFQAKTEAADIKLKDGSTIRNVTIMVDALSIESIRGQETLNFKNVVLIKSDRKNKYHFKFVYANNAGEFWGNILDEVIRCSIKAGSLNFETNDIQEIFLGGISRDDVKVECWGRDLSDGKIGGWKSTYPHCILDDGNGGSNAVYDGRFSIDGNKVCLYMENLSTQNAPANTLAVGFKVSLMNGRSFSGGGTSKIVEMKKFSGNPNRTTLKKCIDVF